MRVHRPRRGRGGKRRPRHGHDLGGHGRVHRPAVHARDARREPGREDEPRGAARGRTRRLPDDGACDRARPGGHAAGPARRALPDRDGRSPRRGPPDRRLASDRARRGGRCRCGGARRRGRTSRRGLPILDAAAQGRGDRRDRLRRLRSMRIGVLTGGGDCPGLNAVIRAVARRSWARGHEVIGVREGWRGMVDQLFQPLGRSEVSGILPRGGTILGTTRTNPFKIDNGVEQVRASFEYLDALVAIGGEDTLGVASKLYTEFQAPVVGVPKTIDNDLAGTDYTFGFDTAVAICTEAIDRLHTTAESHNRVMVVEVMGRHAGWIAVHSGIAGGADVILIPERPVDFDEVANELKRRHEGGKNFSIVVVSEGCELPGAEDKGEVDQFGHKLLAKRGVGETIGEEIESRTGYETRVTVLGHVQRGGSPTPRDRILATRFGLKAADLVEDGEFGKMAALRGDEVIGVSLEEATAELKTVPPEWYDVARAFFG